MNNINTASVLSSPKAKVSTEGVFDSEAEKLMDELSKEHSYQAVEGEKLDRPEMKGDGSTETGDRLIVPDNDDGLRPDLSMRSGGSDDHLESMNSTIQSDVPTNRIF